MRRRKGWEGNVRKKERRRKNKRMQRRKERKIRNGGKNIEKGM